MVHSNIHDASKHIREYHKGTPPEDTMYLIAQRRENERMIRVTRIVAKRKGWSGEREVLARSVHEAGAGLIDLSKGAALGLM